MPKSFKDANVTPIPKRSSPSLPSHFRPISLLPILSKVLERFVSRKWFLPFISDKAHPSQFASLPGTTNNTTTALTLLYHRILKFLDSSPGVVRILTVDFAKAFDKILHSGIISASIKFSLPKESIAWISSFLADRRQRVRANHQTSSWQQVSSGVPQGSVLGPLLFCMFIDDLQSVGVNSSTIKYADDLTILHFLRDPSDDNLQSEFDHILSWSVSRCLPINTDKCFVLDICTKKSVTLSPIYVPNGSSLPQVSSLRLLGVTISSDLKWKLHIDNVLKKCYKRIFLLRNLRRSGCPLPPMLTAYNATIRSILLYSYPCFCNLPKYLQLKLLRFEKRIFRIIGCDAKLVPSLIDVGETMCQRLFLKVVADCSHPLRTCFVPRSSRTRDQTSLQPVLAKTVRLSSSFLRFGR